MYRIVGFVLLLALSSCSGQHDDAGVAKDSLSIERIFTAIADTDATVCFSNGQVYLYTCFKDELSPFEDSAGSCFRRIFNLADGDTSRRQPPVVALSLVQFHAQLKEYVSACYDSLGNYPYIYDTAVVIQPALKQGERIDKAKNGSGLRVYSAFNSAKWTTDLYVAMGSASVSVNICGERERADFFLHDIAGDSVPEICVVRHFLMPSTVLGEVPMVQLDIYKLGHR